MVTLVVMSHLFPGARGAANGDLRAIGILFAFELACVAGLSLLWRISVSRTALGNKIAQAFRKACGLAFRDSYLDEISGAIFENGAKRIGAAFDAFDARAIDAAGVNGAARTARRISRLFIWLDTRIVDGAVRFGSWCIESLSMPVRMIQSGRVRSYLTMIVCGLIAFLAYCFHLAHQAMR